MPGEDFIQSGMLQLYAGNKYILMCESTVNGAANSAVQTFVTTAGMQAGDKIQFDTTGEEREILSVDSATQVTLTATINSTNTEPVYTNRYVDPLTCGIIILDGNNGRLYLDFDDINELEGRMWLVVSKTGDTRYRVLCADSTTINGLSMLIPPTALDAFLILCSGGQFYSWTLGATV